MPFFKALRMPSSKQRVNGTASVQQDRNYWVVDEVAPAAAPVVSAAAPTMLQHHHHHQYQKPQPQEPVRQQEQKLTFHCQLAHGSPTGLISGFGNLRQLYFKIAECFNIRPEDVSKRCVEIFLNEIFIWWNAEENVISREENFCAPIAGKDLWWLSRENYDFLSTGKVFLNRPGSRRLLSTRSFLDLWNKNSEWNFEDRRAAFPEKMATN